MTLFEKIIAREIPSDILYEDDKVIAIYDIHPKQPGHFLVIPKQTKENILGHDQELSSYLFLKALELARKLVESGQISGFKLQINTGTSAGQEVMHTHIHIIPYK
ncbi:histidine triad protein HinT [Mycoplasmopsis gallopavonis]|uniref:Histidine triad nucleotide-binding (HIT-like) protein n=1 Tax=Mycoplasmopsis gallopavonis TaxID=76629 RepID=A0A449AZL2_9BACT|nr:HIT family protein [Mycoplasmopsis gallopavonis]RIV16274.1 HIT family protein [Mycoplasmopsis gallopavonis]VEU72953.1 histidine triad nucleotide-binding (HIT-like) protein [Mycoplasmopsis gallopavonis]